MSHRRLFLETTIHYAWVSSSRRTSPQQAPPPVVYRTLLTWNPLNCDAAQIVYAPMFPNDSQSPTRRDRGSCVTGHTTSIESHVGPHTLAAHVATVDGTWNEPFRHNTSGCGSWWSNMMQLNAPYTPSLM